MERNLWDKFHNLLGLRKEALGKEQIREMLKGGAVQFAEGNLYLHIRWIPLNQTYDYWKAEVIPHLMEPTQQYYTDELPDEYGYHASKWELDGEVIVFLEIKH
jgi:hypothetical protein